ncbi:hypothetical protein HOLleu_09917 [Holothuria leucospilota]|uniref:Uncharacterized protein n=1 Tax=Holothuria leucospilota TaxID=206669 RepID=A0A9Q1HFB6_HOLLE|nr:hypothetical protein HOLleu_09917 [Holothuria leucospilota]
MSPGLKVNLAARDELERQQKIASKKKVTTTAQSYFSIVDVNDLRAAQENDPAIGKVLNYKRQVKRFTVRKQERRLKIISNA